MSRRLERVGDQVRDELNRLLLRELRDPRVHLARVSRVEVSADLQHARVAVSALGADDERDASIEALRHAAGFLRTRLARSLQLRTTPALDFHLDRGAEHSLQISQLLEDLDVEGT